MKMYIVPIVTILTAVLLGTRGVEAAAAFAPGSIEEYEKEAEEIGKRVRACKFPTSVTNEFATMISLYDGNVVEADGFYKLKMCRDVGFVRRISKDLEGAIVVTVVGRLDEAFEDRIMGGVRCYFPKSEAESVAKLNRFDQVIIRGLCMGKALNIVLFGCHIDEVLPRKP